MNTLPIEVQRFPGESGRGVKHALHVHGSARERGMALVMSLVILLILTILGISAMGTASLEEKMSGNTQEGTRAFEVAESGLQSSLGNAGTFSAQNLGTSTVNEYTINGRVSEVTTTYLQSTDPPRGSGYDSGYNAVHFKQVSKVNSQVDSANIGLNSGIERGIAQISNKPN